MTSSKTPEQLEDEYGHEKEFIFPLTAHNNILGHFNIFVARSPLSFVERLKLRSNACVFKIYAKDNTGKWASFFILTNEIDGKSLKQEFSNENDGLVDLTKFGKIIASYYGEGMPDNVKQQLVKEHGFLPDE